MGLLTDFFVAIDAQVLEMAEDALPADSFDTFQLKGVDTVKVDLLYAILTDRSVDDVLNSAELVREFSEDGPWVFRLPSELVASVAALASPRLDAVATKWAECEEFEGWSLEEVRAVVYGLVAIAGRAQASRRPLFHWVCL
jgi:hypothetical protein